MKTLDLVRLHLALEGHHGHQYKYRLDEPRIAILGKCYRQLAIIQPYLDSKEAKEYFSRLDKMAGLVLDWIGAQYL